MTNVSDRAPHARATDPEACSWLQDPSACKCARYAAHAAREASELAPLLGCVFRVMEAGNYWGAYRPVLAALQVQP